MDIQPVIRTKNLVKQFKSSNTITAVDDVSIKVMPGEVFGVIGRTAPARLP
jgi:ABC-type oligopeptide transport system ATPase subunit